jgi:TatD DNase family protein
MPDYFDVHSHIAYARYDNDRDAVLARMREKNIWTITVGTDKKESKEAVEYARKNEGIFATIGLHPADNTKESFDASWYGSLIADPKVVMVGECGLDYFHEKTDEGKKRQKNEFEKQIEFAVAHDKPLMLHIRDAHKDALEILSAKKKEYGERLRGNAHFFTETPETAKSYYELGFTTSFPGVITFTHDYDDTVKYAPKDLILAETDSPYATPVPHRGKRNEPTYVIEVVEHIAKLRGEPLEEVKKQLVKNAFQLLGL